MKQKVLMFVVMCLGAGAAVSEAATTSPTLEKLKGVAGPTVVAGQAPIPKPKAGHALKYRLDRDGFCRDSAGEFGRNPSYIGECGDLTGMNLAGADLRKRDLRGAGGEGVILSGADLSGADLRHAKFFKSDLRGATFNRANMRGAGIGCSDLTGAKLVNVASFEKASFSASILAEADMSDAGLGDMRLVGCDLRGADLSRARTDLWSEIGLCWIDGRTKLSAGWRRHGSCDMVTDGRDFFKEHASAEWCAPMP